MSKAAERGKGAKRAKQARQAALSPGAPGSPRSPDSAGEMPPAEMAKRFGTLRGVLKNPYPPGTLTIAMIVKNEAKNIREAVESFRPIADEIVIYDTGSTDGTQAILDTLGVRWIQGEWRNDFAWARNRSIDEARCSWVLWMDADDRIPADQVENFRKLKTAPLDRAFGFQVINTQGGLPIGGRFMQLRMFPNHPDLRFRYKVHEQLLHAVAMLGLHVFWTETTLHHTGYEDHGIKLQKARRNLLLLEEDPERVAREPSLAMAIGDSYYILGEYENGIEAYKRAMEMPDCETINRDIYRELPSCIGQGYQHLGRREEALAWYDKTIALQPEKHEAYFHKAQCLMEMGRPRDAEPIYAKLVSMPVSFSTTSNQYDLIQIYAHYHLARFAFERREIPRARGLLETLLAKHPQVVEAWRLLGDCQLAQGELGKAEGSWNRAIVLNPKAVPDLHAQHLILMRKLGMREEYRDALGAARVLFPEARFPEWADPAGPASAARPGLSLCMIVKNEAAHLPACLESARGLADELIIVDTGSTDDTREIALRFGARLIQSDWNGDFSRARNLSLDAATGRWIIWLDADDRLLEADKAAIRALAEADPELAPKAYGLMVKNSRDGGLTGTVFNQIRVFPNRPSLRFRAPVHEQILPALEEAGIPVEYLPFRILHTGYADPEVAKAKQVRNRSILEAQVRAGQGITPVTLYTLGCACADLGDAAEAVGWFRKAAALARETGSDPHVKEGAPAKAAAALASLGRLAEALEELAPCLALSRPGPEALLVKAQIEAAAGRPDAARPVYERLLDLEEGGTFLPVDFQLLKIQALQWLGQYWYERGQRDLAVALLKAGLQVKEGRDLSGSGLRSMYRSAGIPP
jgi:glycosyltransferase involved in cell wall biosynthesis